MQMVEMTTSFRRGNGNVEHNLRITKEGEPRKNGDKRRRKWNQIIYYKPVEEVLHEIAEDALMKYNLHQIEVGHKERIKSFDDWKASVEYTRKGKTKSVYNEVIIQAGNKFDGCPYVIKRDEKGNPVDKNGKVIPRWNTSAEFVPVYDKNGRLQKTKRYERLCDFYRDAAQEFLKANPNFHPVFIGIHADEDGGVHLHCGGVWKCKTKNGIGVGIGRTSALKQQLEEIGVVCKNQRKNNAQKIWTEMMRERLIPQIALRHGIKRVDGKSAGRQWKSKKQYTREQQQLVEELKQKQEEVYNQYETVINAELKQQKNWLTREREILKELHPDVMEEIRAENIRRMTEERKNIENDKNFFKKIFDKNL